MCHLHLEGCCRALVACGETFRSTGMPRQASKFSGSEENASVAE